MAKSCFNHKSANHHECSYEPRGDSCEIRVTSVQVRIYVDDFCRIGVNAYPLVSPDRTSRIALEIASISTAISIRPTSLAYVSGFTCSLISGSVMWKTGSFKLTPASTPAQVGSPSVKVRPNSLLLSAVGVPISTMTPAVPVVSTFRLISS